MYCVTSITTLEPDGGMTGSPGDNVWYGRIRRYDSAFVEPPSSSRMTPTCLLFRCCVISVVLPCHAISLLQRLQQTHFLILCIVKCSHTLEDFGRTVFSASAMFKGPLCNFGNFFAVFLVLARTFLYTAPPTAS